MIYHFGASVAVWIHTHVQTIISVAIWLGVYGVWMGLYVLLWWAMTKGGVI